VAVASAGPHASLHLRPITTPASHHTEILLESAVHEMTGYNIEKCKTSDYSL